MVAPRFLVAASLTLAFALAGCTTPAETPHLQWSEHADYGEILTDGDGYTLYLFTNDEGGESSCYDQCAVNWPPLTTDGEPTADTDVPGTIATTERTDGTMQVTYDGDPLYYYTDDGAPGDANGEGVGDIWFVIRNE